MPIDKGFACKYPTATLSPPSFPASFSTLPHTSLHANNRLTPNDTERYLYLVRIRQASVFTLDVARPESLGSDKVYQCLALACLSARICAPHYN